MKKYKQLDVFRHTEAGKAMRSSLADAMALTVQSLQAYGSDRSTWVVGFSGGKDSTATVTFIDWAIKQGKIKRPENLILVYADTLMELPSLEHSAYALMEYLGARGWQVRKTKPALKTSKIKPERFFVTMLGRGYPPPHNKFRWCTDALKAKKLEANHKAIVEEYGDDFLGIDGMRLGESAVRDAVIVTSCSKGDGECGQGWFHKSNYGNGAKLSPILHWRVCHVWDWIVEACFEHGYPIGGVIETYGVDITDDGVEEPLSARTGCIGCPLVTTPNEKKPKPDKALATVLQSPDWSHLAPYARLSDIYWRLRWDDSFRHHKKNGEKGCLTLAARKWALGEILGLQSESARLALGLGRAPYVLIEDAEVALIREMLAARTFPDKSRYPEGEFDEVQPNPPPSPPSPHRPRRSRPA
jgi:DNA sulfur modification protein DndC